MKKVFYVFTKMFFFICLKVYNRFKVINITKIPLNGRVIVVANHCSNLDPIAVGVAFPGRLSYLAKAELFKNPILSFLMKAIGAIPVSKESNQSAGAALKAFLNILESGSSVLLFPEGARSFNGKLQPLEGGAALIAMKSKVPVLPVYISGTHEAMPRGSSKIRPVTISVIFGDVIDPEDLSEGLSSKESRKLMIRMIEESLLSMESKYGKKLDSD